MNSIRSLASVVAISAVALFAENVSAQSPSTGGGKPMDNLGYGELGVYGGGITRGAPTPSIDHGHGIYALLRTGIHPASCSVRVGDHMPRYIKILVALSIGLLGALLGNAKPLIAAEQNPVTAIDILLEPDATMLRHAQANNARLLEVFPKGFALVRHTVRISL